MAYLAGSLNAGSGVYQGLHTALQVLERLAILPHLMQSCSHTLLTS